MEEKPTTEVQELTETVESVESKIEEISSPLNVFKRGLLRGLGGAFGATLLFAIVASVLAWIVSQTDIPWIDNLLEPITSEQI